MKWLLVGYTTSKWQRLRSTLLNTFLFYLSHSIFYSSADINTLLIENEKIFFIVFHKHLLNMWHIPLLSLGVVLINPDEPIHMFVKLKFPPVYIFSLLTLLISTFPNFYPFHVLRQKMPSLTLHGICLRCAVTWRYGKNIIGKGVLLYINFLCVTSWFWMVPL